MAAKVEDLVNEYDAGRAFDPEDLEPWEWSGIVAWRTFNGHYTKLQSAKLVALLGGLTKQTK